MPIYRPDYDDSLAKICVELKQKWMDWNDQDKCPFAKEDLKAMSADQQVEFLGQLIEEKPLPIEKLEKMQEVYDLSSSNNSEIKFKWIRLGLKLMENTKSFRSSRQSVALDGRLGSSLCLRSLQCV